MSSCVRTLRAHIRLSFKSWIRGQAGFIHLLTMLTTFRSGYKLTLTSKKPSPCTIPVYRREVSFLVGVGFIMSEIPTLAKYFLYI